MTSKTYNNEKTSQTMFSEILLVDRSKERIRKLSRRLSKKVSGTSRSREDIDAFFLSLNLIDWIALITTFIFQFYLFTKGHHLTKSIIKFSALFVYFGLILFLIIIASENSQKLFLSFNQLIISDNIFQQQNFSPFISVTGTMFAFFSILMNKELYDKNNKINEKINKIY